MALLLGCSVFMTLASSSAPAQVGKDAQTAIRGALLKWMADFNAGHSQVICDLFAPELLYAYRGFPERNYQQMCSLLQSSLTDRTKKYNYTVNIQEILVSVDLAVVRLVWRLTVSPNGTSGEVVSTEPGMDVFRKQPDGSWKIVRFIGYDSAQ